LKQQNPECKSRIGCRDDQPWRFEPGASGPQGRQSRGHRHRARILRRVHFAPLRGIAATTQSNFDYLQGHSGQFIAFFYGAPNRETVNSVEIILMDPRYEDEKVVLLDLKSIV
jgi:hypothetical protein